MTTTAGPGSYEERWSREISDPADRLIALRTAEALLAAKADAVRDLRRQTIAELRELGLTWRVIGDLIGSTAQQAEQLARPSTTTKDTTTHG